MDTVELSVSVPLVYNPGTGWQVASVAVDAEPLDTTEDRTARPAELPTGQRLATLLAAQAVRTHGCYAGSPGMPHLDRESTPWVSLWELACGPDRDTALARAVRRTVFGEDDTDDGSVHG